MKGLGCRGLGFRNPRALSKSPWLWSVAAALEKQLQPPNFKPFNLLELGYVEVKHAGFRGRGSGMFVSIVFSLAPVCAAGRLSRTLCCRGFSVFCGLLAHVP